MKKYILLFSVFVFSVLVACGGSSASSSKEGDDFVFDSKNEKTPQDVKTLITSMKLSGKAITDGERVMKMADTFTPPPNAHGHPFIGGGPSWFGAYLMYEPLADYDPIKGIFMGRIVESYDIDGATATLNVRKGITWSDGEPINVDDVILNIFMVDPSLLIGTAKSYERIDDYSLKINFAYESNILFLRLMGVRMAFPKKYYQKYGDIRIKIFNEERVLNSDGLTYGYTDIGRQMNTDMNNDKNTYKPDLLTSPVSGIFKPGGITASEMSYIKNDKYFGADKVLIDKVIGLRETGLESTAISITSGALDMESEGLSMDMAISTAQQNRNTIRQYMVSIELASALAYNVFKYPIDNRDFRRAISYIISTESFDYVLEAGCSQPDSYNTGFAVALRDKYFKTDDLSKLENYNVNHQKATEILESIGWKKNNGKWFDPNGQNPEILITGISEWVAFLMSGEAIANMLKEFGLNVVFRSTQNAIYAEYLRSGEAHMFIYHLGAGTWQEPYYALNTILSTFIPFLGFPTPDVGMKWEFKDEVTGNVFNYSDKLSELLKTTDENRKQVLVKEFGTFFNHQAWFKTIYDKNNFTRVHNPKLSFPDGDSGKINSSFFYVAGGSTPDMIARMIKYGEMYFVE